MTLNIQRFMLDSFEKQVKINHFPGNIRVGKPEKLKPQVKQQIRDQFGELFLNDANYLVIAIPKDMPFDEKSKKKFAELAATVYGMEEIDKTEIKQFGLSRVNEDDPSAEVAGREDADPEADEPATDPVDDQSEAKYLMLKITTK